MTDPENEGLGGEEAAGLEEDNPITTDDAAEPADPGAGAAPSADTDGDAFLGRTVGGDFELRRLIGQGAAGRVYLARRISTDQPAAVKVVLNSTGSRTRVARFHRETQTLTRLSHPNILRVFANGDEDDCCWFAMEFARGGDVFARMSREPVPWETGYRWFRQTLAGLQGAHDAGLVHRDIKPQNLMLTAEGDIRIADFGLVKVLDDEVALTQDGRTVGSPAYMSPEQALGRPLDARSDIYGAATTFFHVFSGRAVFGMGSQVTVLLKQVKEAPPLLEEAAPHLPLPLCWVLARMLEKEPVRRYQTATAVLADLDGYEKYGELRPRDGRQTVDFATDAGAASETVEMIVDPAPRR